MALTSVRPASLIVMMRAEYRALKSSGDAGRIVSIQFSSLFFLLRFHLAVIV